VTNAGGIASQTLVERLLKQYPSAGSHDSGSVSTGRARSVIERRDVLSSPGQVQGTAGGGGGGYDRGVGGSIVAISPPPREEDTFTRRHASNLCSPRNFNWKMKMAMEHVSCNILLP